MENHPEKTIPVRLAEGFYRLIQWGCMLCLAGQVLIISYAVAGRFIWNHSPAWAEEISRILMVWMSLLSAALAVKDKSHVRMTVFDKAFGKMGLKIREVVFTAINILFCGVLFWKGIELVRQTHGTKLPGSGLPTSLLYGSVCIGGACMAIMLIYQLGGVLCQRK